MGMGTLQTRFRHVQGCALGGLARTFRDMNPPPLDMERLYPAAWSIDFAEAVHALYGDPEVVRHFEMDPIPDVTAQREEIRAILGRNAMLPDGYGSWLLFERESDALVGVVLLKPLPFSTGIDPAGTLEPEIEVGWHLSRAAWGKGYATEAGRAVVRYGFEQLHLDAIHAVVHPQNEASKRVCARVGLPAQGLTKRYYDRELEHFRLDRGVSVGRR